MKNHAQIVATIGPSTKDKEILLAVTRKIDAARLNFSWGTHEEHAGYIKEIREEAKRAGRKIVIIQDLSGPRIQEKDGHEFDENAKSDITPQDIADLNFGTEQGVDMVAMSYVGSASDINKLREEMGKCCRMIPIIAKIERKSALKNIDEIIEVADAIMVARGDLGNEIPLEKIPFVEREIVEKCKIAGKPVIVATQMLLSMTESPKPTRAEVTDVAFAVLSGADAVMLSEETASGKYPVEAVTMMEKIIIETTSHLTNPFFNELS
jgi:pyruvate kinase